jgi:hypothetical protein
MSHEEMRDYCLSLANFKLRVQVRLKNGQEIMTGKIARVDAERFQLVGDDQVVQSLNYAWIARIKDA